MDYFSIVRLAVTFLPTVKSILDAAISNESIVEKIKALSAPLARLLEQIGEHLFPKAEPELRIAAAAMAAFDPNVTIWLQNALNKILDPSPNLVADGIYGGKTRAAVELVQAKLGLDVDGWAGRLTQAAIMAALAPRPLPATEPAPAPSA